ncbi:MAG: DUF5320 domain-containing protein [Methanomicrobiales archaeon]|nr:DUF5320 domain-containing protein [Methanomicrobiales archaeon]
MPGFDGTGPLGRGPLTGRRRGRCVLPGTPAEGTAPVLRGLGRGGIPRGCGRGFRARRRW